MDRVGVAAQDDLRCPYFCYITGRPSDEADVAFKLSFVLFKPERQLIALRQQRGARQHCYSECSQYTRSHPSHGPSVERRSNTTAAAKGECFQSNTIAAVGTAIPQTSQPFNRKGPFGPLRVIYSKSGQQQSGQQRSESQQQLQQTE